MIFTQIRSSPNSLIKVKKLSDFHLDKFEKLLIIDHITLVEEDDEVGDADLLSEEDVLPSLRHGAISGGNDKDSTIHLSRTGNHILDIVGMPRAYMERGTVSTKGESFTLK